ncbi:hypothetical protein B0T20DRAFT_428386 [Sordaria brevicollis]|uniref:Uncharacterized protein n=1 Tax=Sordaria brevicollis TaxID=83679 RepID=A0AAE0PMN9_SORBR|nr:hypothetical protein B0T20DRAFT_428386 [Sordaria brevicollis]
MDNPPTPAGASPPPSPPSQPQESILNRKILPRGLPHSFSSNLNRDVTTPSKKANKRTVQSIIASIESEAAIKQQKPIFPSVEPITPRNSTTIRSSSSTGASLTSFRRVKGSHGRDRGVSECHDARNSQYDENGTNRYSDAGSTLEGTRSVSTPVIRRTSSILPFSMEEEDSLTLLNYKSYFNQPLARCLDGFADFEDKDAEEKSEKNEEKKLSNKPDIDQETKPLRITKRQDRVKTAAQTETHPSTSAPRPVQRQSRRPSLVHRKSSASIIALEKLMHELENFSINPPLEEEDSDIIAMPEDKPIIRRDPKEVQDYWWKVRCELWVDEVEVYEPEEYHETNIGKPADIPKIQLPLPGTANVSVRASHAFDKQIPLPAPPVPFRSPNRVSSLGRGSPSSVGTPTRLRNRSVSTKSTSPLKYSVLAAGHPPPSPSASVQPEPPTPLSAPSLFRQSPSPPPRSSKRPVSPPLSTAGKYEFSDDDTPKASLSKKFDLSLLNQEHAQPRGPSGSSSLDANASTTKADWDSASEYEDEGVREQKAENNHHCQTQPNGPSLEEIDGLGYGGSQENTPKAESAFNQIQKKIEQKEEKKRSTHNRNSSLARLSMNLKSESQQSSPDKSPGAYQVPSPQRTQSMEEEQDSPARHSDSRSHHSHDSNDGHRHTLRRLHLSAIHIPGLRHLRNHRHSKQSIPSSDSDSQQTPTTANSFSSTRANISSPVPILSAGISNPGDSVPSIPYSVTRAVPSARSSLVSIAESGNGSFSGEQNDGQKTPTEKDAERNLERTGETVVSYPRQYLTKVPKLEEAPKGRGSERGLGGSGGGFREHFRSRNKSRSRPGSREKEVEDSMVEGDVEDFLHSHKRNSPTKEGDGSQFQREGRNNHHQPHNETQTPHRRRSKEGTTGLLTSSPSAPSIPPRHFGRSHHQPGDTHHPGLTSLDDTHLPNHTSNPSAHQIPYLNFANTISHFTRNPMATTAKTTKNPSPNKPTQTRRSREDHLSEIESHLNKDSFHTIQSMRSLHSQSKSLHSMQSIPESKSTGSGSMYSQDQQNDEDDDEGKKREDASVLIGEVLETVRGLGEQVVGRRGGV